VKQSTFFKEIGMTRKTKNRFIAGLMAATLAAGACPPPAIAGAVATDAVVAAGARDRVALALARAEVRAKLETYGVSQAELQARVAALSDKEVAQLAERLDSLPSGGNGIVGAVVFVFLVLLITDIVGLTKVFPFTRSIK
jgi:hypothetical protein